MAAGNEGRRRRAATPQRRHRAKGPSEAAVSIRSIDAGPRKRADLSRQVDDDTLLGVEQSIAKGTILNPPFDILGLNRIISESSCLPQAIDAMVSNLAGYGFRGIPTEGDDPKTIDAAELQILSDFVEWSNTQESLSSVHRKYVHDYESYGFGFYEVIRNRAGDVSLIRHGRASRLRLVRQDAKPIEVKVQIRRGGKLVTVTEKRRFRRFVQVVRNSHTSRARRALVFFKEFGDPRAMNWHTGRFQGEDGQKSRIKQSDLATEIVHGKQISEDQYGQPRWIGQLPGLLGTREAEVVNLRYFEDNTVPPMMLLVSGGRITRSSFDELTRILQEQGIGRERQNQIMLVEAVPETSGLDDKGSVDLKLEKLAAERQSDGLFSAYDDSNCAKLGSSFRLPNTLLGKSQDVTFATANVSAWIAESQVFIPERRKHDELLNKTIVNHPSGLGLQTVKLQSMGPVIVNPSDVIKAVQAANTMGAMTPRKAVDALNDAMEIGLSQYPEKGAEDYEDWMDKPLQIGLREIQQTGSDTTRQEQGASDDGSPVRDTTDQNATAGTRPSRE